jgi:hypothetical protein
VLNFKEPGKAEHPYRIYYEWYQVHVSGGRFSSDSVGERKDTKDYVLNDYHSLFMIKISSRATILIFLHSATVKQIYLTGGASDTAARMRALRNRFWKIVARWWVYTASNKLERKWHHSPRSNTSYVRARYWTDTRTGIIQPTISEPEIFHYYSDTRLPPRSKDISSTPVKGCGSHRKVDWRTRWACTLLFVLK